MRPFILFVLSLTLTAAALPDPTKDLSGRSLIANLATLRSEVAARPKDPAVWAAVTRTYAMLALHTEQDMWGAYGPWWDYAHRARVTLDGLRAGEPTTLEHALPGLWVDLLDRDARRVITTLDRLAPSSTNAEAKALRAMALGKRDEAVGPGALLHFAFDSATMQSLPDRLVTDMTTRGQDPWSLGMLQLRERHIDRFLPSILRAVCADTIWMLQSNELSDDVAKPLLNEFLLALELSPPAVANRQNLVATGIGGLQHIDLVQHGPQLFIASWRACQACLDGKHGWEGITPRDLVALGDVARWNRDRQTIWLRYLLQEQAPPAPFSTTIDSIRSETGLIVPLGFAQFTEYSTSVREALIKSIRSELTTSESHRFSTPLLLKALASIAAHDASLGASLVEIAFPLIDRKDPRGLAACAEMCLNAGRSDLIFPRAAERRASDPWSCQSFLTWTSVDPDEPMLAMSATLATAAWHAKGADVTAPLGIKNIRGDNFAVRWSGTVALPREGEWQIALGSDEQARLVVGTTRVDNPGGPTMPRKILAIKGPTKDMPLRIECINKNNALGCQLWWKGPTDNEFSLLPESALSAADGTPGLRAELFEFADEEKLLTALDAPSTFTFAREAPWVAAIHEQYAYALRRARQYSSAAEAFTQVSSVISMDGTESRLGVRSLCYLMQEPPKSGSAAALLCLGDGFYLGQSEFEPLLHRCATYPGLSQQMAPLLASRPRGRKLEEMAIPNSTSSTNQFCTDGELIRLHFALSAGDLEQALAACHTLVRYRQNGSARVEWLKEAVIIDALLSRLLIPQWTPSKDLKGQVNFRRSEFSMYEALADWLVDDGDWSQVMEATPENLQSLDLLFVHALYTLSTGAHAAAKAELQDCIDRIPASDVHHHFAQGVSTWLTKQNPEELQSLPQGKPLRMGLASTAAANAGGNNF